MRSVPFVCTQNADAVLAHYDEAQIRGHVLILAQRRTRECLRAPTCYELEVAR